MLLWREGVASVFTLHFVVQSVTCSCSLSPYRILRFILVDGATSKQFKTDLSDLKRCCFSMFLPSYGYVIFRCVNRRFLSHPNFPLCPPLPHPLSFLIIVSQNIAKLLKLRFDYIDSYAIHPNIVGSDYILSWVPLVPQNLLVWFRVCPVGASAPSARCLQIWRSCGGFLTNMHFYLLRSGCISIIRSLEDEAIPLLISRPPRLP